MLDVFFLPGSANLKSKKTLTLSTAQIAINNRSNKASVITPQLAANHFSGTIPVSLSKSDRVSLWVISATPIVLPAQSAGPPCSCFAWAKV